MSYRYQHDLISTQEYPCGCCARYCLCGCANQPYIDQCALHAAAEDMLNALNAAHREHERGSQVVARDIISRAIDRAKEKPNGRAAV